MTAKEAIRSSIEFSFMVTETYVKDLSDAELMVRSVPGTNHAAWQLGHLIVSNHGMAEKLGHNVPALPENFAEAHTKETATSDDPKKFFGQVEYMRLMQVSKEVALAAVDATPEAQLDAPSPEPMRAYAPTVGGILNLLGAHWLMHAGQLVPIRRKLGRDILM
jgi:hypothetical protein